MSMRSSVVSSAPARDRACLAILVANDRGLNEGESVRYLEALRVRSAGAHDRRGAALDGLQRRWRRQTGQILRARARRLVGGTGALARGRSDRQAARQSGDRELSGGGRMKFAVIMFPGSNCDHDAYHAAKHVLGQDAEFVWHKETSVKRADVVILPGGFSHGDYLRTGAIARFSPIMTAVREFAAAGGPLLGICNGFQVLCEAKLLPGALLRNRDLKFHCEHIHVRVEQTDTPFTSRANRGQVLNLPIAHGEGNYYADPETIEQLEATGRVVLRYCDNLGTITPEANPNGSVHSIAGICSEKRNIVGLMPHPERACEPWLGSKDGLVLFESVISNIGTLAGAGVMHSA